MSTSRAVNAAVVLMVVGAAAILLLSCAGVQRTVTAPPPLIEGATFVGNKSCFECHTNITRLFPSSPHSRLHIEGVPMKEQAGCESCHGPGSKHVASGGGRGRFILNPGKDPAACYACHLQTHAEFSLPNHHPVREGRMNCVQCHDPHGADILRPAGLLSVTRQNETCAQCHREQSRQVIYEHEALREGCTICHSPHGSINRKLLTERDANLCLRCHAQTPGAGGQRQRIFIGSSDHTLRLRQGACWSAGCHTAIHGSNINPTMLY